MQETIPKIESNSPSSQLDDEIKNLISERNIVRKKWQKRRKNEDKLKKNNLSNKINRLTQIKNNESWDKKLENLKPSNNSLWKISKSFT